MSIILYKYQICKANPSVTRADIDTWTPLAIIARIADGVPGEIARLMEMLGRVFKQ